ncbi:MAG TPA: DUF2442 domain-containing protein [Gemmatirosa sp.]
MPDPVHPIHRVRAVAVVAPYTLEVAFDDGLVRRIDLAPVLAGELYAPLRDPALFAQARVDPEVRTVVWPNGADFDPATLHDWPEHEAAFRSLAQGWEPAHA